VTSTAVYVRRLQLNVGICLTQPRIVMESTNPNRYRTTVNAISLALWNLSSSI